MDTAHTPTTSADDTTLNNEHQPKSAPRIENREGSPGFQQAWCYHKMFAVIACVPSPTPWWRPAHKPHKKSMRRFGKQCTPRSEQHTAQHVAYMPAPKLHGSSTH